MATDVAVTGGGDDGTNGARTRLAWLLGVGFAATLVAVTIANATSMQADFAVAGLRESTVHIWIWQVSSVAAWLAVLAIIWWMAARVRPPRFGWAAIAAIAVAGVVPASLVHVALMVALRKLAYALGGESYVFTNPGADPWLYEFRKDVGTYLQFLGFAVAAQWLLARVSTAAVTVPASGPAVLEVPDGAVTHHVPVEEIDWVAAAGNYVEIGWRARTLLHRATLSAVADRLGDAFVRVHRGRLVRRAAIRRVTTDRSGDFTIELTDGTEVRGSRRYPLP